MSHDDGSAWTIAPGTAVQTGGRRRTFQNQNTEEVLCFDYGVPGEDGFGSRNHYHALNPNSTGRHDAYLDNKYNPVCKGSLASYIFPSGK